jgi:sugar lactone lactonase YvrE
MRRARPDATLTLWLALAMPQPALADTYGAARTELVAAYEAKDYPAMREAANRALAARPGYPAAMFNLALATVLGGDAQGSLAILEQLLAQQIEPGVDDLPEFAPLKDLPGWADYTTESAALRKPVGNADIAWRHDAGDFIPEGIAVAPAGHSAWLGSIRYGTIRRVGDGAGLAAVPGPHWSVFGMRLHAGRLWFASSAVGQFAALDPADAGRTGLFSLAVNEGTVRAEVYLPEGEGPKVLGDLEFAADDKVYLSDQAGGVIYHYDLGKRELSALTEPGALESPQGMALAADGGWLYAADYTGGLVRVDRASGEIERVSADSATNLYGIDGLYRHGNSLIAIQNGIRPNRVVQLYLADHGTAVGESRILAMNLPEFDEPNLGQVAGNDFYFIANSHWNRFDAEGNLPSDLDGPVVLRIDLGPAP